MQFIPAPPELRGNILGKHFGIAAGYIYVRAAPLQEKIQHIIKCNIYFRIFPDFLLPDELNLVNEDIGHPAVFRNFC